MAAFSYTKDAQNIVTLTMDMPGRPVNVINEAFAAELTQVLERLAAEDTLAGVIITSAKPAFLVGLDLEEASQVLATAEPALIFTWTEQLKARLRTLETLGKPVAAALNGSALGGGLELALACHYRLALDDPQIRFGLPEVKLGLIPGGGGIIRLTRLLGLQAALPYLMEGQQVKPRQAKAAGIIDALAADEADLLAQAKAWILANPQAAAPWDKANYQLPGGDPHSPSLRPLLAIAPAMLKKETYGNYPAPEAIMNVAVEGALVDFDTASRVESRHFVQVATGQVARNMINTFWFQLNEIKAGRRRPQEIAPLDTQKVGVLGAGMMGHGIAYVTAWAGMEVVLKDVNREKAAAGKAKIADLISRRVSGGQMTATEKEAILNRIQITGVVEDLAGCDLIIEAVFEDRTLKKKVTQETEAQLAETAIFASNTSTLPITSLAESTARPENFIGLHFFSPVEKMRLVEIICGEKTSAKTLAKAFDYVLKIRKTPIVVNDSRGFYTSRVFGTYTMEGLALLGAGQLPQAIEAAGRQAGMPVGPLAILDEVSLALAMQVHSQTQQDLAAAGKEAPAHPGQAVLEVMVGLDRLGKAHGAGFYDYPKGGQKRLWPELQTHFPAGETTFSQTEMIERLMFVQALETVRCYEEGVVTSVAEANIGSIFGWGFAPFKGGTLQYINDYGLAAFVDRSRVLAKTYGRRFEPPAMLIKMAQQDEIF